MGCVRKLWMIGATSGPVAEVVVRVSRRDCEPSARELRLPFETRVLQATSKKSAMWRVETASWSAKISSAGICNLHSPHGHRSNRFAPPEGDRRRASVCTDLEQQAKRSRFRQLSFARKRTDHRFTTSNSLAALAK